MLMGCPWGVEAFGVPSWVAPGVGTASVLLWLCMNMKTLLPELHPNDFVCTCYRRRPPSLGRGQTLSGFSKVLGYGSVALILPPVGLQKPCQKGMHDPCS